MLKFAQKFKVQCSVQKAFTRSLLSLSVANRYNGPYLREPMDCYLDRVPKKVTAEEAVSEIGSNSSVFIHSAAATPLPLTKALAKHGKANKLQNVNLYHMHTEGPPILTDPSCYDIFVSNSLFTAANCRKAIADGKGDYIPIFLSEIPILFRKKLIELDYALVTVSPPDKHGYCTTGTSVDCTRAALQTSKKIIALVNKQMPCIMGHGVVHVSHFDYVVEVDEPLHEMPPRPLTEKDTVIGKLIAENLVEDGATLQLGIGAIPDSVLSSLNNHKGLGIHSEMISDGVVDLVLNGAIDNSMKRMNAGKTLSSFSVGTKKLYDFMDNNPAFLMGEVNYTNSIYNIAQNPKPTAINSCIEVDLTGQVVSETIGKKMFSGIGGQVDFLRGASLAEDGRGKPILAMHSVTNKHETKIVSTIKPGAAVTTSRHHVHYVVTEHGIAYLYGKTLKQRAYELIQIAHPDFREELERDAYDQFKAMPTKD